MFYLVLTLVGILAIYLAPRRLDRIRRALLEHLSVITRCALPIGSGLRALADERLTGRSSRRNRLAAEAIREVASRYEAGGSLAQAFAESEAMLAPGQLDLLRVAEGRGALPLALEVLCDEEAKVVEGRGRLLEWLAYPTVVGVFVLLMVLFQSTVILPKFAQIQASMDVEPTALNVDVATAVLMSAFVLAGVVVFFGRRGGLPTRAARVFEGACDLVLWRAPFRQRRHGRWMKRAAALLRSGATLPEALDGAAALRDVGGRELERAALQAREGQPLQVVLATALGRDASRLLAPVLLSAEGESSLGVALEHSGQRLLERATRRLHTVAEMLKPVPIGDFLCSPSPRIFNCPG